MKYPISVFVAVLIFSSTAAFSQTVNFLGFGDWHFLKDVIVHQDGGFVFAGQVRQSGTTYGFVAKTDVLGNLQWSFIPDTTNPGEVNSVSVDSMGNIYGALQRYSFSDMVFSVDAGGNPNWYQISYCPDYPRLFVTARPDNGMIESYGDEDYYSLYTYIYDANGTLIDNNSLSGGLGGGPLAGVNVLQTEIREDYLSFSLLYGPSVRELVVIDSMGSMLNSFEVSSFIATQFKPLKDNLVAIAGFYFSHVKFGVFDLMGNELWIDSINIPGATNFLRKLTLTSDSTFSMLIESVFPDSTALLLANFDKSGVLLEQFSIFLGVFADQNVKWLDFIREGSTIHLAGHYNNYFDSLVVYSANVLDPYFTIQGQVYVDENQNGIREPDEFRISGKPVSIGAGLPLYTDANGYYTIYTWDSLVTVKSVEGLTSHYNPLYPTSGDTLVNATLYPDDIDFGWYPSPEDSELAVQNSFSAVRPGITAVFRVSTSNSGIVDAIPASTTLSYDSALTILSIDPAPAVHVAGSITWISDTLSLGEFLFKVEYMTNKPAGSILKFYSMISPIDYFVENNTDSSCLVVTGSYDPNDKLAIPIGVEVENRIDPTTEFIDYTIRFQNTGNDTAFTVRIEDPINLFLFDLSSIEILQASHPVDMSRDIFGNIDFQFDNILLPDSGVNLEGSQGYVEFRIDLKTGLPLNTLITNYADIYFDFNEPIRTNTVKRTLAYPTPPEDTSIVNGINVEVISDWLVYPNPASDELFVGSVNELWMFDLLGRKIEIIERNGIVDISALAEGQYFILGISKTGKRQTASFVKLISFNK